jgi:hypothetical protein
MIDTNLSDNHRIRFERGALCRRSKEQVVLGGTLI